MSRTYKILSLNVVICVYFLATVNSQNCSRQRRDAEENEHHLLNILKDHEIIPDIIDDASHADTLEVIRIHSNFLFLTERSILTYFFFPSIWIKGGLCF